MTHTFTLGFDFSISSNFYQNLRIFPSNLSAKFFKAFNMMNIHRHAFKHVQNYKGVNTFSSLATTFNTVNKEKPDYSGTKQETGLFNIPELKTAEGFSIMQNHAIAEVESLVAEGVSNKRRMKIVEIFDDLSNTICKGADLAEFIRIAHPEESYLKAAEDACISLSGIVEKLNTHRGLFDVLSNVTKNGDIVETSKIDEHVANLFLFDFQQSGIHLPQAKREKVVDLNDYILQVGQQFMARAVMPRAVSVEGLSPEITKYFTAENRVILVSGLYANSPVAAVREAAYKFFLYPDKEQERLLQELLNSRHELASLCGFPSYADRVLRGSTMQTPNAVMDFLNILNNNLREKSMEDIKEMQKMKIAEIYDNPRQCREIMAWDTMYYTQKAKKTWLHTSSSEFAPYLSLGACMEGLNILTQELFGVRLEIETILPGEVWADNIQKLAVIDEKDGLLGHIYCDFFTREGKPNQDCHYTIRGGKLLPDSSYQNPIVVLMLNYPLPKWSGPCLLDQHHLDNLFHEMGHALHSMFGRTKYQHVTGTRCATDFAEVPSVLMEYFASDPRVVSRFAKHYSTQETMPDHLIQKFAAGKNVFCAFEFQNQVFYSMLDQVYHSNKVERPTTDILSNVQKNYHDVPYVENTAWQLRFSHLVGYGGKYYAYLISRAIAAWIWQTYFEADPFSRSSGEKYRNECLAHGGGKPPSKLVSDFLNQEASPENFAKSLLNEVDAKNEYMKKLRN